MSFENLFNYMFRYGDVWGDWHGGSGGAIHSFEINPGSVIDIVQGKILLPWKYFAPFVVKTSIFWLQEDKVVELMKLNLLLMMVVFLVHMVATEVGHGFLPDQGASSPTYQELLEVAWTQSFYIMNVKLWLKTEIRWKRVKYHFKARLSVRPEWKLSAQCSVLRSF